MGSVEKTLKSSNLTEEAKVKAQTAKKEETISGQYKLNSLLSRVLESELQDVMIKVWQEFPDKPSSRAETVVVNKFRNEAGDDLRNTLGLNVTKRLLNVFNKLFVQIQFHPKMAPDERSIEEFIKKYNVKSFRRLEGRSGNIYVAELKNIKDFDLLCSSDKKIDNWRVLAVKPCYRFRDCPPNLDCIFSPDSSKKVTPKKKENEKTKQDDVSASSMTGNKEKINEPTQKDSQENVTTRVETNQTSGGVKDVKKDNVSNVKSLQNKPNVDTSKNVKNVNEKKENPLHNMPNKPNAERTKCETKPTVVTKPKHVAKPVTKNPGVKLASNRKTPIKRQDDDEDDNEELNDEEILKLLSGGIVIDECSGSDQE